MTRARSELVSVSETPWYHVVSRCVRRAFLCGVDHYSGRSFEHRRGWIAERAQQLASVFAVDVAAYAVMSNHYHLVLRIDVERARGWSREEVLRRWTQLFDGPPQVRALLASRGEELDEATDRAIDAWAQTYRARLCDLSWFMRVLNESVARQANAEDEVTGRFWEGRFKSQALLDEQAVLAAMAYVDLNPIRARMAATPEDSEHTSIAERIAVLRGTTRSDAAPAATHAPAAPDPRPAQAENRPSALIALRTEADLRQLARAPLMPFDATARLKAAIPFAFDDYLELVDTTGRCIRADKRGAIGVHTPRLLDRLGIEPEQFIACATTLMQQFGSAVGAPASLARLCAARQARYLRGMAMAKGMFERRVA